VGGFYALSGSVYVVSMTGSDIGHPPCSCSQDNSCPPLDPSLLAHHLLVSSSPSSLGLLYNLLSSRGLLIALMMEAVGTSETSVNFNLTTRRYIPEDSKLKTTIFYVIFEKNANLKLIVTRVLEQRSQLNFFISFILVMACKFVPSQESL
jgi:hypothetical protein